MGEKKKKKKKQNKRDQKKIKRNGVKRKDQRERKIRILKKVVLGEKRGENPLEIAGRWHFGVSSAKQQNIKEKTTQEKASDR